MAAAARKLTMDAVSAAAPASAKQVAAAADRNKEPILAVLSKHLSVAPEGSPPSRVLEIAAGTGQHAHYFATHLGNVHWTPTDGSDTCLPSINAWCEDLSNVDAAATLDVTAQPWPYAAKTFDAVLVVNLLHISPWKCTEALFRGVSSVLKPSGKVFVYGPFHVDGLPTAPSNETFDKALQAQNPDWGIRDMDQVEKAAHAHGITLLHKEPMPANNFTLIFEKDS